MVRVGVCVRGGATPAGLRSDATPHACCALATENPLEIASAIAENNNFQTPLDEIDAAARVLDPVIQPLVDEAAAARTAAETGEVVTVVPPHGLFFKDFRETEW